MKKIIFVWSSSIAFVREYYSTAEKCYCFST